MQRWAIYSGLLVSIFRFSTASATLQPYWVQTPISSAAITADPTLSNYKCYDLRVTVTGSGFSQSGQDRFTVGELLCQLSPGAFYSPTGGGDKPVAGGAANLAYDTYITAPDFVPVTHDNIGIAGQSDQQPGFGNVATFPRAGEQQSALSVAWANFDPSTGNGDYELARLTVSNDATGALKGLIMSTASLTDQIKVEHDFSVQAAFTLGALNVAFVPEPATLGLLIPAIALCVRRRRK